MFHISCHFINRFHNGGSKVVADVHIGKELAQELAYNLIENAIRYNKPGGRVTAKVQKRSKILS